MNDFLEKFANMFDETDSLLFKKETKYKEIGEWSSLLALSTIAMVDEEYEVVLSGNDIQKTDTLGELFELIQDKKKIELK